MTSLGFLIIALAIGTVYLAPLKVNDIISVYRLPSNVLPELYKIELTPYLIENEEPYKERFTFDGKVSIIVVPIEDNIKDIVLHVKSLSITKQTVTTVDNPTISHNAQYELNTTTDKFTIKLDDALIKDTKYIITFEYNGVMSDDMLGFYKSSYTNNGIIRWLAATQFEFTHARKVFPCFDEPNFKAEFQVTINHHKDFKAISNTALKSNEIIRNRVISTFEKTPKMSSYTLAFLISDFNETQSENKNFSIVTRPDASNQTKYSLEIGQAILQKLNEFTNLNYNELGIPKIHMAAIPDFSYGAMENWGLVTFKERALLYNANHTTDLFKQSIATIVAHELAHMWFGNLVTCDWWSYAWLNEGFATYFEYFITHEIQPDLEMDKQFIVALQTALILDSGKRKQALTVNEELVETYSEISSMFDKITYNKGAAVIRMFKEAMGAENFKRAIRKYLEAKQKSNSKPDELFKYFTDEWKPTDLDTMVFFQDWTTQPGYPLVNIILGEDGKHILVKQTRFFLMPADNENDKLLYTIPLTYSLENDFTNIKQTFLNKTINEQKIELDKEVKWIIGNINQVGYYRVNYDEKTWYNIYNALNSKNWNGISEINRAQIVDDLMNLGQTGYLRYGLVLNILDYLKTEINYLPWTSAFRGFSLVVNKMSESEIEIFGKYILQLLDTVYNHLGFTQKLNEKPVDIYTREKVLLWACKYGHKECITKSKELFTKMEHNIDVPLNIRAPVYCTAIREGSVNEYQFLVKKYEDSNEVTEKFMILTALSCTKSNEIINLHYDYILSKKVRKQDKKSILTSLYKENPLKVFNLIVNDYKKINDSLGSGDSDVANILLGIAKEFFTKNEKELFEKFINENKNKLSTAAIKSLEHGIRSIDYNINLAQTYTPAFIDHLNFKLSNKNGYRLSTIIKPSDYTIKLIPYLSDGEGPIGHDKFTFDGDVSITLSTTKPDINEIILHAKYLNINKITLYPADEPLNKTVITNYKINDTTDKLYLTWDGSLTENKNYILNFNYTGRMDDDMHGFYKSNYKDKDGKEKWLASTQFQTVHARRAFPCFDEPKFKATFNVIISRKKGYTAVSNMKIKHSAPDGERVIDTFETTPIMSTYILAFLVSDFEERSTDDKNFLVIARSDAYNQTEYSFDIGQKILDKLNQYTGIEYKTLGNTKMHMAAIPDFSAGAMENWGLLTYRERALLYDETETTAAAQQSIAAVIAHEQAHMWFGDYVTCDWWGYTWLNEGFARYFQYEMTHQVNPSWELDKQFVVDQIHSVMKMDSLNNTHPMSDETIESPSQVSKMFGSISYNKGATIIRMINNVMNVDGEDKFQKAIQKYLKAQAYKNSIPDNLFTYLNDEWNTNDINKTEFFYDWTTQVGYPLVNFTLNKDKKEITVTQERFLLKSDAGDPNLMYTIPLTFTTSKDKNFNDNKIQYLKKSTKSMTIQLNDKVDWIIGNIRQFGYYRVTYDTNTWHGIHHALSGKNWSGIHEINRAQIVDDLMNLGQSGHLGYDLVLNILEYLETELNYLPWSAAFNGFSTIQARIGSDNTEFSKYILHLINKVYNQLGFDEKENDSRLDKYNRPKVLSWACKYGHKKCIETAKKHFNNLKENKTVQVNIRSPVYCSAIRDGTIDDYNYLIQKYEKSLVATEEVLILAALGCAKNPEIVTKYYEYILSDSVRRQDKSSSLTSLISQNPDNSKIIFKLIEKNFKKLGEALADEDKDVAAANIISSIANYFTSQTEIDELIKFHNDSVGKIDKKALDIIEKASKTSKENIEWSEKHLSEYKKYLLSYLEKKKGSAANKSLSILLLSISFILTYLYY